MVWLRKEKGGTAIRWHDRVEYAWPGDGDVCEVPDDLARDLLGLDGYSVAEPPQDPEPEASAAGGGASEGPPPPAEKPAAPRKRRPPASSPA